MPATPAAATFPELLDLRLRTDPGQPLLTMYDDSTGERTELSVTTYANWVAKTAGVLVDDLMLDPGDRLLVDLPAHWLGPVFLGAAWTVGLQVTTDPTDDPDARVCGPAGMDDTLDMPTLACALLPFAVAFRQPLPTGATDFGIAWPGQPDAFTPVESPTSGTMAWTDGTSQQALLAEASRRPVGRLLTDTNPLAGHGVPAFLAPLAAGGSLVLVRDPDPARWEDRRRSERATDVLR